MKPLSHHRTGLTYDWQKKKKTFTDNANLYASYYANFSGNWNNGDNAGPFQFNVNYATSNSNSNLGTHQMFDPSFFDVEERCYCPGPRQQNRAGALTINGAVITRPLGRTQKSFHLYQ